MAKLERCQGCGRHCPRNALHCKYGQKYFAQKDEQKPQTSPQGKRHKWEKHLEQGSVLWQMLQLDCRIKKALRKEIITETQLMEALAEIQNQQLGEIIQRLSARMDEFAQADEKK